VSEIGRRLVHASGTGIPALYLLDLVTYRGLRWVLVGLAVVVTVLEVVRLGVGLDWAIYDRLTREYEQENVAGYALYMYSMCAVVWLLPEFPSIAVASMLMLSIGDPISGVLGSNDAGTAKELGVLAAMFGVCFAVALPFVPILPAALGALGATAADGLKPVVAGYVVDDNLSIPPTAAAGMVLGFAVLARL
jgi:dolichol kinase